MCEYKEKDLLRLAKRYHNTKRTYLLVDPLQGKHIPVSPSRSLRMLRALGEKFAKAAPDTGLVIGFAETATAVGAVVAEALGAGCKYIQTTREAFAITGDAVFFEEEHSHATSQFLCLGDDASMAENAGDIAFVDDEISTGKTLLNSINAIRAAYPALKGKRIWAVSIINRLSDEQLELFDKNGISCCWLLHLPMTDYTSAVENYVIREADPPEPCAIPVRRIELPGVTFNARHGANIHDYRRQCGAQARMILEEIRADVADKNVTVLGTEENMYPGLILGEALEKSGICGNVDFHATTRSPIGICGSEGYPVTGGYRLSSFYDTERVTYIYDLLRTDVAVIVTDSPDTVAAEKALTDIVSALAHCGCKQVIMAREAEHVRNI